MSRRDLATRGHVALLCAALLLSACATVDFDAVPRERSVAWAEPQATRLGRPVYADARSRQQSAFALLDTGVDALAARLALVDAAERTLDLQYYIVRGSTSRVVADRLIVAADRGVRVRLLVDDTTTFESEEGLAALDGHRNIEVRAFNPFHIREPRVLAHTVEFALRGAQLNRRMHNKTFVADSAYAIVGGRNLGDEYFGANDQVDFYDFDLLAAGPLVRDVAASFDRYWNSDYAIPLAALVPRSSAEQRDAARGKLADARARLDSGPIGNAVAASAIARAIRSGMPPATWARSRVMADEPEKVDPRPPSSNDTELAATLMSALERSRREILVVTPYLVPGAEGVAALRSARVRGAVVRALTNSLATTDSPLAHAAGYSRYRVPLLEAGVELYELRPSASPARAVQGSGSSGSGSGSGPGGGSRATLHGKVFVVDGSDVMIGSFNLDRRSAELNTETVLAVRSPALAGQLRDRFARATAPRNSYRVTLEGAELRWTGAGDSGAIVADDEPETTPTQRLWARAIALLPVERQL